MTEVLEHLRAYWEADADTYAHTHTVGSAAERAAWNAALARLLPPPPARVLDVGAGTGVVTLLLAQLGYQVTALDFSSQMLGHLQSAAEQRGLQVTTVTGPAHEPPAGPFDAVTERLLLWGLPEPSMALASWRRQMAPTGRLVAFEGLWGNDAAAARWQHAREGVRRLRRAQSGHHAPLDPQVREQLPYGHGIRPDDVCAAVEEAGWGPPRLERLRDVEWAALLALPPAERLLGTVPWYAVTAG